MTTPAPIFKKGTILLSPLAVTEGIAIIGFPPSERDAPRMKSIWPPTPEYIFDPMESAHTCPVRSISSAQLIAATFWILTNDMNIVYISDIQHFDRGIIINELVQFFGTDHEAGDNF